MKGVVLLSLYLSESLWLFENYNDPNFLKMWKKLKQKPAQTQEKANFHILCSDVVRKDKKQNKQTKTRTPWSQTQKLEEQCMWLLMPGNGIRLWSRKHTSPSLRAPSQLQHSWVLQLLLTKDLYVSCSYFMHSWWLSCVSFTIHCLVRNVYHCSLIKGIYIQISCRDQQITESVWALVRYRDW